MEFKAEFKKEMVRKLLLPGGKGVTELCREIGVTAQTLYNWRDKFANGDGTLMRTKPVSGWSSEKRSRAVLEFARLTPTEIGEWLRKNSLQSEHLELWEKELVTMNNVSKHKEEIRILKNKNKQLEKDLFKKDKALAELSAIVILQKKTADLFQRVREE